MTKDKSFVVRINEKELDEFNKILKRDSVNRAALFRKWIRDYIKESKNKA